jgi:hypothetical protein
MGLPYDAERVGQLRGLPREKKKLSAGLKARRKQGSGEAEEEWGK